MGIDGVEGSGLVGEDAQRELLDVLADSNSQPIQHRWGADWPATDQHQLLLQTTPHAHGHAADTEHNNGAARQAMLRAMARLTSEPIPHDWGWSNDPENADGCTRLRPTQLINRALEVE